MSKIRFKKSKRKSKVRTTIYNHIINNKGEYLILTILFFIGLISSVILFNNLTEENLEEINVYLTGLFNNIKNYENIDLLKMLKESLVHNIIISTLLWLGASTIIGIPTVYGTIAIKGFSLGYTICSILNVFEMWNGLLIAVSFLMLHNIIFVPTMFAISVSGIRLYKSIMKNKQTENIKLEILRHTIFCFIMLLGMIIAAFVETYLSTNLAIILLKNIKI